MIAQALRLHECLITRHIRDFLNEQKLQPKNGGSESLLSDVQKKQLIEHLTEVGADPFLCWFAILSKSNHVRSVYE